MDCAGNDIISIPNIDSHPPRTYETLPYVGRKEKPYITDKAEKNTTTHLAIFELEQKETREARIKEINIKGGW